MNEHQNENPGEPQQRRELIQEIGDPVGAAHVADEASTGPPKRMTSSATSRTPSNACRRRSSVWTIGSTGTRTPAISSRTPRPETLTSAKSPIVSARLASD
jgi:hypothetical protein